MNTQTQEALKMAIEAMEDASSNSTYWEADMTQEEFLKRIQACKEALEQPSFDYNTAFSHGYEAHKAEREYPTKEEMLNKIFEATYQQHSAKLMQPNEGSITFNNPNTDWVLRITPSRKIEVNEDVEVTEAAQKVLDAIQPLLDKQTTQEPVAKQYLVVDENDCHGDGSVYRGLRGKDSSIPTYRIETHPAPSWQGLNDDEIQNIADETDKVFATSIFWVNAFARAIEQALRERNT